MSAIGFEDVLITECFDCFRGTSVGQAVSPLVRPHGANIYARCPR
jgi:hypothetical protein